MWPHDNAIIALGFARYGFHEAASQIFTAMFHAAVYQDLRRLPELFCGFVRKRHQGPTAYPVACAPQAWASAAPFGLLAACLGMELRYDANAICFENSAMPDFLDYVNISRLSLRGSLLDLSLHRAGRDVTLALISRQGEARVMLVK